MLKTVCQYTFRLQGTFDVPISSDFAHIPNFGFPMGVIYNVENRLSILFFISEKLGSKHWGTFKKALILSSESVNMLIRGLVAAVCVVRNHSKRISIVFFLYL